MRNFTSILSTVVLTTVFGLATVQVASAQKLAVLGTTSVGAIPSMATTIAKIVSEKAGFQMRTQAMASETQYVPLVARGQLEFGISNIFVATYANKGTGIFDKQAYPGMRLAFTIMPFRNGVIVHRDSNIRTRADLKGKRWPAGFQTQKKGLLLIEGIRANFGIKKNEINSVPVAAMPQMWGAFKRRNVDVAFVAMGAATVKQIAATVGGVRFIPFDDSPDAAARMEKYLPGGFFAKTTPQPSGGFKHPSLITHHYDFTVWTHKSVSEDVVYKVVKAIYESEDALKGTSPLWRRFKPEYMAKGQNVKYHSGSIRLFKEKGVRLPGN